MNPADLAGDPGEEIEILLLFARGRIVRRVVEALRPGDFYNRMARRNDPRRS